MRSARQALGSVALVMSVVLGGSVATIPTPLYPVYTSALGFGALGTTLTFAVFSLGAVAGLGITAAAARRLPRRTAFLLAGALQAGGALVLALDAGMTGFVAGRIVTGLGVGVLAASGTALVLDVAETSPGPWARALRTLAPALAYLGLGAGTLVGGLSGARDLASVHAVFAAVAIAVGLCVAATALLLPRGAGAAVPGALPRAPFPPAAGLGAFLAFALTGLFGSVTTVMLGRVLPDATGALAGAVVTAVFGAGALGVATLSRVVSAQTAVVVLMSSVVLVAVAVSVPSLALFLVAAAFAGAAGGVLLARSLRSAVAVPGAAPFRQTSLVFAWAYLGLSAPIVGLGVALAAIPVSGAVWAFAGLVVALGVVETRLLSRSPRLRP